MALNNCSINSQSFTKTGGSAIGSNNAQLIITPNTGYVVSASDFTNNTGAIAGISAITLSDSDIAGTIGNTVLVDIDLDDTYIMPSSNTELVIDIDGNASLITYTLGGTYSSIVSNALPVSETNTAYTVSGNYESQETVFTKTFTANSGYYFESAPNYTLLVGEINNYNITTTNTLDLENRIVSTEFNIKYTFPNYNKSNDSILFNATAIEYYVPAIEISAYNIVASNLDPVETTRTMKVYGTPGAEFSLSVENEDSTSILSITDQPIPSSGVYEFNIVFPGVTDSDQYDFVLTGDLSSSFDTPSGQSSTFSIKQLINIDVSIGLTHTNSDITISAPISENLLPGLDLGDDAVIFNNTFTISSSTSARLNIAESNVNLSEFTNLDIQTNGGTGILIDSLTFSRVSDTEISAALIANVYITGDENVTSVLSLDSYIEENVAPVAQAVSISVNKGGSANITLVATDANNDTLTYNIATLPSVGTLYSDAGLTNPIASPGQISGNIVYYLHDNSDNFDTSFTYKANDGYIDSNTTNVNVAVGVSPGESVTVSGATGVFLIPIVLGTDPGVFKAHLNAQGIPDRFQILFDTAGLSNDIADMEVVADSLWVGDDVVSDISPFNIPSNTTVTGLNLLTYNGSTFDTTSTGTESYTITDADVAANTGARTTATPNGPSRNSSGANQLGVQDLVYTSTIDTTGTTGLNYADGNIALTYTKGSTTSYRAYIRIFGPTDTQWNLFQTEFIQP
jgi:hypothetical protein